MATSPTGLANSDAGQSSLCPVSLWNIHSVLDSGFDLGRCFYLSPMSMFPMRKSGWPSKDEDYRPPVKASGSEFSIGFFKVKMGDNYSVQQL